MSKFLTTVLNAYKLLEEEAPADVQQAPQPDAALPNPTPEEVDQQGETETAENDSNKIILVGIVNKLLNLTMRSIQNVANIENLTTDQKMVAKEEAETIVSKLKALETQINAPGVDLNQILSGINNEVDTLS
jgi:hypothetical protein